MTRLPFDMGLFHYDDPPPDHIDDLDALHDKDAFREANELRAWIVVEDGRIASYGHSGRGLLGSTRLKIGPRRVSFPGIALNTLRPEPSVTDSSVRFVQTVGGRMALPAPRRVSRKPFFQVASSVAWTTLALTIHADGSSAHEVVGASPFPRHWIYDRDKNLIQKSGTIDFEAWYRGAFGKNTPWGDQDSPALVTDVETQIERELSLILMREGEHKPKMRHLKAGDTLVKQGEEGHELFLLLDGVLSVDVDGEILAEIGPGAILGERAHLEGGRRAATLRAVTDARVAVGDPTMFSDSALEEVATGHRREQQQ
ncbi:MAG TPA: cyclic nucleotide-binding domain-containing protein [Chloroflexota bacterium]